MKELKIISHCLSKVDELYQYQFPGFDIILKFCKMLLLGETG